MISLSDASRFAEESPSIKKFKPWWEIVTDYVILAELLMTLLAWARVISVDASGLLCIPANDKVAFGFVESRYANTRCSQEFDDKLLLYYPYLLFFQWVLAFLVQRTWLKVPAVITKLDAFHDIFTEMCTITPKFRRNAYSLQMLPELKYEGENLDKVKVLHDKLMFLLTDKSYLVLIYSAKVIVLFVFSVFCMILMISWSSQINFLSADFACDLKQSTESIEFKDLYCNFAPAFFLYGILIANTVILVLIVIFSTRAMFWIYSQRRFADDTDIFGQMKENYMGLPGFKDLQFCMSLIRKNVRDGNIMFEVIKSCLREKEECPQPKNKVEDTSEARNFEEENAIVQWIAKELGLELVPNKQDSNHLFECLDFMKNSCHTIELDITVSMRERLAEEIEKNPLHFKTMIDNDPEVPDYDTLVEQMRDPGTFGNQYAVAAAANVMNIRIVIIHCQSSTGIKEVFNPYSTGKHHDTRFLTFTSDRYYHATKQVEDVVGANVEEANSKRLLFATDERFRNKLRQSAVRCIGSNDGVEYAIRPNAPASAKSSREKPSTESIKNIESGIELPTIIVKSGGEEGLVREPTVATPEQTHEKSRLLKKKEEETVVQII